MIIKRDDNKSKGELNSRSDVELSFVRSAYRRGRKFRVNCCTLYAKRGAACAISRAESRASYGTVAASVMRNIESLISLPASNLSRSS